MVQNLKRIQKRAKKELKEAKTIEELEGVFRRYLGRRGELTFILRSLAKLPLVKQKELGKTANLLRDTLKDLYYKRKRILQRGILRTKERKEWLDITAPGQKILVGHLHPLTQVQRQIKEIFQSMGFGIAEGPEIETEWYNFDALNIPKEHPARDLWDTFWLKLANTQKITHRNTKFLLRTHTSPVQIRYMESHQPPFRIIAPGRIFRYEATDASHEINFYQLEGLMVGKDVTASHFKAIIQEFFRRFFKKPVEIRLRPSFFPFTEPSFEVDMSCLICQKRGCSSCGNDGWIEIMGAGMVHPNVFKAVKYDPQKWQGFAFGMGLDRITMMKYKINDIRLFYSGDLRFLQQF